MVDFVSAWKGVIGHDSTNQIGQLGLRWNRASDRSSGQEDNNRIVDFWSDIGQNVQKMAIFGPKWPKMHILDQIWPFLGLDKGWDKKNNFLRQS